MGDTNSIDKMGSKEHERTKRAGKSNDIGTSVRPQRLLSRNSEFEEIRNHG